MLAAQTLTPESSPAPADGMGAFLLVDSGAGATLITTALYRALGSPPLRGSLCVRDVADVVTTARGIGPLWGYVVNVWGKREYVKLADAAYTPEAFGVNLFSGSVDQASE